MSVWDFTLYVFMSIGLTYGLVESAFMAPYRMFVSRLNPLLRVLVYCPSCTGFWAACVVGEVAFHTSRVSLLSTAAHAFAFIGVLTLLRAQWPHLLLAAWGEGEPAEEPRDEREGA